MEESKTRTLERDPVQENERKHLRIGNEVGCLGLVSIVLALVLADRIVPEDLYLLMFGGVALGSLVVFLAARSLRRWRGKAIALWFRPYSMAASRARWIAALLTSALRGHAIVIGLEDSRRTVLEYGFPDEAKRWTVVTLLLAATFALAYAVGADPAYRESLLIGLDGYGVLVCALGLLSLLAGVRFNRRWRYPQRALVGTSAEISGTVERIIRRLAAPIAYVEPLILLRAPVHGKKWRIAVERLVAHGRVAIVTLSRPEDGSEEQESSELAWEVRTWLSAQEQRCKDDVRTLFLLVDPLPIQIEPSDAPGSTKDLLILGRRGNHLFLNLPWNSGVRLGDRQIFRSGPWGSYLRFALFGDLARLPDAKAFVTKQVVDARGRERPERSIVSLPPDWPW